MAKNVPRLILCSLLLFCVSCSSVSPTYSRQEIDNVIKNICKEEFQLDVSTWDTGATVWIYAPFKKLLGEDQRIDETIGENFRQIFLTLRRAILSMDKPPNFYVFIASDIENKGMDLYYMGFIPDLVKLQLSLISLEDWRQREVFIYFPNEEALGDEDGTHITKFDITMGDFISFLVRQHILNTYGIQEMQEVVKLNKLDATYYNGKLSIMFDIELTDKEKELPNPFEEAKKATTKYLKIYKSLEEITEVEIHDLRTDSKRFYTKKALLEG